MTLRVDLIAAAMPPCLDGIGDYTANLAVALADARPSVVQVLTGTGFQPDPLRGISIHQVFDAGIPRSVWSMARHVVQSPPDWLVLQFNQFSYGRWGLNPHLPMALRWVRRLCPEMRLAVMFHELFVPASSVKQAVMSAWQRAQLWSLGRLADVVFFSIQPWVEQYGHWFPNRPVAHLPVGSNIPRVTPDRRGARRELALDEGELVLGLFGAAHPSLMLKWVEAAARSLLTEGQRVKLLYLGPRGGVVRRGVAGVETLCLGPLPGEDISRLLPAMDLFLCPFTDGVSTRRGSMMAALQHGLCVIGTHGHNTDAMLLQMDRQALWLADVRDQGSFQRIAARLAKDPVDRKRTGESAAIFFERHFSWPQIADRMWDTLYCGMSDSQDESNRSHANAV